MAYNFLTLTNDVCRRLNETALNETNFSGAAGVYGTIKDSINYAIRDINQDEYNWPFNHTTHSEVLVPGQARYDFPSDLKTASMSTFRIRRDDTLGNDTRTLRWRQYEEYLKTYVDQEYNTTDEGIRTLPEYVFQTPDLGYALASVPDKAYTLDYEYFSLPTDLVLSTDTPTIPVQFRTTLVEGAMYYLYMFRSDHENTQMTQASFEKGVGQLRSLYINKYDYIKSTMVVRSSYPQIGERVR